MWFGVGVFVFLLLVLIWLFKLGSNDLGFCFLPFVADALTKGLVPCGGEGDGGLNLIKIFADALHKGQV